MSRAVRNVPVLAARPNPPSGLVPVGISAVSVPDRSGSVEGVPARALQPAVQLGLAPRLGAYGIKAIPNPYLVVLLGSEAGRMLPSAIADRGGNMERTDVNPWEWSKAFGFSQAVDLSGASHVLLCSGQTATGDDGAPPTTVDMAEQLEKALDNLTKVLEAAGMTMANVVKLTVYTTDIDELLASYGTASKFLGENIPAMTLVGVTRLAFPELKVEIEATAAK